ncbi:MAG: hypothetical protein IKV95_09675 [Brochothrix sp.]|uniref:hypothetical protein n=1 Tax=Brochothrix sp. TaxID=1993875 RepID=UPI00257A5C24|nr:hypothetical protein [Brochothrix sp.]MBR5527052.1 hypothetical protein [Brochothrix sp.]
MKKLITAGLMVSLCMVGLQTVNVNASTNNHQISTVKSTNINSEKEQAMAKNTLLRDIKVISLKQWNANIFKIATMSTNKQLQEFNDYFIFTILTTPHGSVK